MPAALRASSRDFGRCRNSSANVFRNAANAELLRHTMAMRRLGAWPRNGTRCTLSGCATGGCTDSVGNKVLAATKALAAEGANAVVLAGAALAGFDNRLQAAAPVPLLDGMACGVRMAEMLVALRLPKPHAGSYAAPMWRMTSGISPALAALLQGNSS